MKYFLAVAAIAIPQFTFGSMRTIETKEYPLCRESTYDQTAIETCAKQDTSPFEADCEKLKDLWTKRLQDKLAALNIHPANGSIISKQFINEYHSIPMPGQQSTLNAVSVCKIRLDTDRTFDLQTQEFSLRTSNESSSNAAKGKLSDCYLKREQLMALPQTLSAQLVTLVRRNSSNLTGDGEFCGVISTQIKKTD